MEEPLVRNWAQPLLSVPDPPGAGPLSVGGVKAPAVEAPPEVGEPTGPVPVPEVGGAKAVPGRLSALALQTNCGVVAAASVDTSALVGGFVAGATVTVAFVGGAIRTGSSTAMRVESRE
jgi:hypothetical protein